MPLPKNTRSDNPFTDHDDEKEKPNPTKEDAIQTQETKSEEKETMVSVDPPEKDDEGESQPSVWRQKKRERKEQYDALQRERDEERQRREEAERLVAAMRAQQMVAPQQRPQDPFEEEEKKLREDWKSHLALAETLQKSSTPEQRQKWQDDHYEIEGRRQSLAANRALAASGFVPGQRVNLQQESLKAHLAATYADVVNNDRYLAYADGLARQLQAENQRPMNLQDYEKVMNDTRTKFRLPTAPSRPPSEETRRKFSGGGLGGANGHSQSSREIAMGDAEKKMARAMYKVERDPKTGRTRKLTPEEADAKWAQTVGKKLIEERRGG